MVEVSHLSRVGPFDQIGAGAQSRVAAKHVQGPFVQPPALISLVAGHHHVVAIPHGQQALQSAGPVYAVRAGVQVLAHYRSGMRNLLGGGVHVVVTVRLCPHAVVLHVSDQLVAPHGIRILGIEDDGVPVHVVDDADNVAVLICGWQSQAAPRQLPVEDVVAVRGKRIPEVVCGAALVADHAKFGLGPVATVDALRQRVAAAVLFAGSL